MANPLLDVQKFGQSIWYDNIRRGLITSGELASLIEKDGLLGVTSNPAIFEKAITDHVALSTPRVLVGTSALKTSKDQLTTRDKIVSS